MLLNQLYHDHGVAQALAQHASSAGLRAEHAAEGILIDSRIRSKQAGRAAVASISDRFEVFRADEVQVTSTQFAGGDWRWRLADAADNTLVEGGGYRSKRACAKAVAVLRERAFAAR